ncbi:hypothetical protein MKFW12EY_45390 (plasmid) [Methylomonas koyamae]|nr:hypothetical protein MKFW12EY_45390 [Methylomonas koyamae]
MRGGFEVGIGGGFDRNMHHPGKHVLDPTTGFGSGAVALFFPVGQRFVANPFAVNPASVASDR